MPPVHAASVSAGDFRSAQGLQQQNSDFHTYHTDCFHMVPNSGMINGLPPETNCRPNNPRAGPGVCSRYSILHTPYSTHTMPPPPGTLVDHDQTRLLSGWPYTTPYPVQYPLNSRNADGEPRPCWRCLKIRNRNHGRGDAASYCTEYVRLHHRWTHRVFFLSSGCKSRM